MQREFALDTAACGSTVMLIEAIAVAAEYSWYVQDGGVIQPLLYACHDRMLVVLGLNDGDRDIGFVVKDVIRPLALATGSEIALHIDTAIGKTDFLAHLFLHIPACLFQRRRDELGANVAF